ncbi:DUF3140 domain-containing protein [Sphingomonas sp. CLY1604]|uniref:DUF3140 domain-containing protein n=1 Tax=Sphingomonas sp. CLY1604 TaxID=3457786 RepID=UPI003FD705F6
MAAADDHATIYKDFGEAVNMAPAELERFLDSDDSKRVGWKGEDGKGSGESVGHKSGERIVTILRTKKADLTDDDYAHMKKVVGYVHRHLAQGGPAKDKAQSDWRYSLMNWGHDPEK